MLSLEMTVDLGDVYWVSTIFPEQAWINYHDRICMLREKVDGLTT